MHEALDLVGHVGLREAMKVVEQVGEAILEPVLELLDLGLV